MAGAARHPAGSPPGSAAHTKATRIRTRDRETEGMEPEEGMAVPRLRRAARARGSRICAARERFEPDWLTHVPAQLLRRPYEGLGLPVAFHVKRSNRPLRSSTRASPPRLVGQHLPPEVVLPGGAWECLISRRARFTMSPGRFCLFRVKRAAFGRCPSDGGQEQRSPVDDRV